LNDFSAKNIPFKNMKIQKSPFQNLRPLFFKHFSAKNIPFKIASPKMGNFIDWNFTLTILGDANGGLGVLWIFTRYYCILTVISFDGDKPAISFNKEALRFVVI